MTRTLSSSQRFQVDGAGVWYQHESGVEHVCLCDSEEGAEIACELMNEMLAHLLNNNQPCVIHKHIMRLLKT